MICPNPECQTPNPDTSKFCFKCGTKLPTPDLVVSPSPQPPRVTLDTRAIQSSAQNVTSNVGAIVGSLIGIVGGIAICVGWFLPWVTFGGVLGSGLDILNWLGGEQQLGGLGGLSNGLQIFLGLLAFGFAMIATPNSGGGTVLGLLALILALVVIVLPIMGLNILRTGVQTLDMRTEMGRSSNALISKRLRAMRSNAVTVFVILVIIFITFAALPFGTSALGSGIITMGVAAVGVYIGALLARSMIAMPMAQAADGDTGVG
jgi:hypothetical protein